MDVERAVHDQALPSGGALEDMACCLVVQVASRYALFRSRACTNI